MAEGLRERSRARRRRTIEQAALRLFAEQGYDATTLAQIAAAAEVSTRTVTLYFPAKLDMALSYGAAAAARLQEACVSRPAGRSVADALQSWLIEEARSHAEMLALHAAMLAANPALRGSETPSIAASRQAVTAEFAADLGRTTTDPVVVLASGALIGVISALLDLGGAGDLDDALTAATRILDAVIEHTHQDCT